MPQPSLALQAPPNTSLCPSSGVLSPESHMLQLAPQKATSPAEFCLFPSLGSSSPCPPPPVSGQRKPPPQVRHDGKGAFKLKARDNRPRTKQTDLVCGKQWSCPTYTATSAEEKSSYPGMLNRASLHVTSSSNAFPHVDAFISEMSALAFPIHLHCISYHSHLEPKVFKEALLHFSSHTPSCLGKAPCSFSLSFQKTDEITWRQQDLHNRKAAVLFKTNEKAQVLIRAGACGGFHKH